MGLTGWNKRWLFGENAENTQNHLKAETTRNFQDLDPPGSLVDIGKGEGVRVSLLSQGIMK